MNKITFDKIDLKKIILSAVKVISFILIFVILLELFSMTIFSKSNATSYKNKFSYAYSYVNEADYSIDILAMGNSNVYSCVVPLRLWDKRGYTCVDVGSPRQTASMTYNILLDVLKRQSPKILLLDADMLYEGVELNTNLIEGEAAKKNYLNFLPYISDNYLSNAINQRFSVFLLHDRWKKILSFSKDKDKRKHALNDNANFNHGYYFNKTIKKLEPNDNMNYTKAAEEIPNEALIYLSKINDICKQKNIKLIIMNAPSLNTWSYARHNAVAQYAADNHLDYLDLNALDDYRINYNRDFRDQGNHLNYYGAKRATNYIGSFISEQYPDLIEDKRNNPDFAAWNTDKKRFIDFNKIKKF